MCSPRVTCNYGFEQNIFSYVHGTTSDGNTSDGTTSDGTTSDGTTSDGTTSDGTTSDGTTSDGTLHTTARGGQSVHKMRRQIRVTIMCMHLNGSGTVSVHIVR